MIISKGEINMLKLKLNFNSEISIIEDQYIFWWLGREPNQRDYNFLEKELLKIGAHPVKACRNSIDFRIFLGKNISFHIILRRKYWGYAINCHLDLGKHSQAIFTRDCLLILSFLFLSLRRIPYGKCFILPREEETFRNFLKYCKNRWNLI